MREIFDASNFYLGLTLEVFLPKIISILVLLTFILHFVSKCDFYFSPSRLYLIYHHWGLSYMLYFFIILHHMIAICEDPAVNGFSLPYWVCKKMSFLAIYN